MTLPRLVDLEVILECSREQKLRKSHSIRISTCLLLSMDQDLK